MVDRTLMSNVDSCSKTLASKAGWSAVASLFSLSSRFIAQIIIARMLGPEGLGRTAYFFWLIEIANVFCSLGLTTTLTRYSAELYSQKKVDLAVRFARWVFVRYFLLALLGAVVVGVLFYRSSQYVSSASSLPVLMVLFLVNGLLAINQADIAGRQQFNLLAKVNVIAAVVLVLGVSIGAYCCGVIGVLLGYVAGALIPAVYSFTMVKGFSFADKIDSDLEKRVWKFAFYTWLAFIVSAFVWSRMEIFFLERYWGINEVAMFTAGLTFVVMVQHVATLFAGAFMPHFSQLIGDGERALVQRHYETALRLLAFIIMPLAFCGAVVMPVLLPFLFGAEFIPAVPNAMVLTATSALAFGAITSSLQYACERSGYIAGINFVGGIVGIVLGFLIIANYGSWGAVWVRLLVQGFVFGIGMLYTHKVMLFAVPFLVLSRILFSSLFSAGVMWVVICFWTSPLSLVVVIPLGMFVYFYCIKRLDVLEVTDVVHLDKFSVRLGGPIGSLLRNVMQWVVVK